MEYKRITITVPRSLLLKLDKAASGDYLTRSAYIREAILLKAQLETAITSEATNRDSLINIVKVLHQQRMSGRRLRKTGPLTFTQAQD
jgi:metal-responsive CopG/Arc/MetJ family transcriptional regulator